LFAITGENLTYNVRRDLIRGILFKQVSWFDRENRAPGILTSVLSEDVSALNGMTTETISVLIEAVLGLILGLLVSLILSWRMALLTVAVSPVLLIGVIAMSRL
jgi:ABC-type multidrug transport system fused ATPase/permease subunit